MRRASVRHMEPGTVAELIWTGKNHPAAAIAAGVCRTEEVYDATPDRPAAVARTPNRLILGDRAAVLRALLAEQVGDVALVYVDPPFDTGATFDYLAAVPGAPAGAPRVATPAYRDARGLDAWLGWFDETARLLEALLAPGGSLYVHLDAHTVHYAKVVLDEVFGREAFQREIVWRIGWVSGFKSRARSWIRNHDTILFYAKGGRPRTFNKEYVPYPPGYSRRDGAPPKGPGYPIEDVWNGGEGDRLDSIQIVSFSGEKVGYPTQKNEALVARILRASSNPGDLVVDCFAGSGTTAVVAERLGRRWIASDSAPVAIHAARKRIAGLRPPAGPFVVQSLRGGEGGGADRGPGRRPVGRPEDDAAPPPPERDPTGGELALEATVEADRVTVAITAFHPAPGRLDALPPAARAHLRHWSQWIEGWCVDWDHDGEAVRVGSSAWRASRSDGALPLALTYTYAERRPRRVLVKAFDFLGGRAVAAVSLDGK